MTLACNAASQQFISDKSQAAVFHFIEHSLFFLRLHTRDAQGVYLKAWAPTSFTLLTLPSFNLHTHVRFPTASSLSPVTLFPEKDLAVLLLHSFIYSPSHSFTLSFTRHAFLQGRFDSNRWLSCRWEKVGTEHFDLDFTLWFLVSSVLFCFAWNM